MDRLNYETLSKQGDAGYLLREAPERVLQFGEGASSGPSQSPLWTR